MFEHRNRAAHSSHRDVRWRVDLYAEQWCDDFIVSHEWNSFFQNMGRVRELM